MASCWLAWKDDHHEGAARIDDTIYWVGSLGNTRSGNVRPQRDVVLVTQVSGMGAETDLEYVGIASGFRDALVAWDNSDAHGAGAGVFQFERALQPGYSAEGPNSLNLEGAALAPDGESLWFGFRSPLVPVAADLAADPAGDLALIIEIADIASVIDGTATIEIADYFTLDLGGRAIRDITETDDGNYLISAGSADDAGNLAIFGWSGDPSEAPIEAQSPLGLDGWTGSYEAILGAESLEDGTVIRVLQDAGTLDIYGTGTEAQDLTREFMKFPSHEYVLDFDGAFEDGGGEAGSGEAPTAPDVSELTPGLQGSIDAPDRVTRGTSFEVGVGSTYEADQIDVWVFSTPTHLGTRVVNAQGVVSVSVPNSVSLGQHRLVVTAADGTVIGWQWVTVVDGTGQLSTTGAAMGPMILLAGLAGALLIAGGSALVLRKRREA